MRLASALLAAAAALTATAPAQADPIVVELFTSQGCSSCPPADALLAELAGREDVIALSLHVDYWDWIGWADTFADPAFSARQQAYAAVAGSSVVYTPQFVVGGADHVAGAKGMAVAEAVQARLAAQPEVLEVEDGTLILSPIDGPARLILAEVTPSASVSILRGENAGREITYHHIVRGWTDLGEWDGAAGTLALPAGEGPRVVLAQRIAAGGRPGAIVGAARLP